MFNWNPLNNSLVIFILIVWEMFWKAIALWRAAKRSEIFWFLAVFLINFFGIIPLFYLWRTKQLQAVIQDVKSVFKK